MKVEHLMEQSRGRSIPNGVWNGTPQTRAGARFSVEQPMERNPNSPMERSTHLLVGGTVERAERFGTDL